MGVTTPRPVLVYGAGGFGREIVSWLRTDTAAQLQPVGFIDDTATLTDIDERTGLPVGPLEEMVRTFNAAGVLIALGSGILRQRVAKKAEMVGLVAETFVHSSVLVGERVEIGRGSLILPGTILTCDIKIGDFVVVNCSCNVGHDVEVSDYATLLGNNSINGAVRIGEFVTVGSRATIHPGKQIGSRSTIGIGSVVIRSVREGSTVFGNPAKAL